MTNVPVSTGVTLADRQTPNLDIRNAGLDALKAYITLLVLFHHTAITYGAIGGWFYREVQPDGSLQSLLLVFFCTINQAFFMGVFFLIAGYFTPGSLRRKGTYGFLRERFIRLGLPLIVFGWVLGPITVAIAQTSTGKSFADVLFALWRRGAFYSGPLWFAQALILFSIAAIFWERLRPTAQFGTVPEAEPARPTGKRVVRFPSNITLLLAALGCGAVSFLLRLKWPVGTEAWGLQLGYFASYVLLFAVGYVAADRRWLESIPAGTVQIWRQVAWIALPTLLPLAFVAKTMPVFQGNPSGGWNVPSLMYAFWEPFVAWGAILWLLSRSQNRVAPYGKLQRALARRAYCIYVIHPVVLVSLSLMWRAVALPPLLKFLIIGSATCAVCFWIAGLLLQIPAVRRVL